MPLLVQRLIHAYPEHAIVLCLVVGEHVQIIAVIYWRKAAIDAVNHLAQLRIGRTQILGIDINTFGRNAVADGYDEVASVLGDVSRDQLHLSELFAFVFLAEDDLIGFDRTADAVVINDGAARVIFRVVQPLLIRSEIHAVIARAWQHVCQVLAAGHIEDAHALLVRSAFTHSIDKQRCIFGDVVDVN